jgi:preprotein translocase subunit YajC
MITELKSGDSIVTSGGIHGTITNVKDDAFVVRIADNVKIELTKQSVGSRTASAE